MFCGQSATSQCDAYLMRDVAVVEREFLSKHQSNRKSIRANDGTSNQTFHLQNPTVLSWKIQKSSNSTHVIYKLELSKCKVVSANVKGHGHQVNAGSCLSIGPSNGNRIGDGSRWKPSIFHKANLGLYPNIKKRHLCTINLLVDAMWLKFLYLYATFFHFTH